MAKNKGQKNAGNKPKQETSSPITAKEIPVKTNEDKPATPEAFGNKKLQLQMEREAREEEERKRISEDRAKQEAKNNSAKKKNKKSPRVQNVNEPKHQPQQKPKETKYSFDQTVIKPKEEGYGLEKTFVEPKVHTLSGDWVVQSAEFNTQCKIEPANVQEQVDIKNQEDWGIGQENAISKSESEWRNDNSYQERTSKPIINRNFNYDDSSNSKYGNPESTPKQNWKRANSNQAVNHSWSGPSSQNEMNDSSYKSNWENKDGYFYRNKRQNNDYNERKPYNTENYPRDNRGRGDYNQDGAKSRISDSNYGREDNYSSFSNRGSTYNRAGPHRQSFGIFEGKNDREFQEFRDRARQTPAINYGKLSEVKGDLFTAAEDYSLAHCVAEDMSMGAGIAKTFRTKFGKVGFLLNQREKTGGLAILEEENRFIYYLVTKEQSRGKPTLHTLWMSLKKLKEHVEEKNVTKLAIPQIGCGLDRLDWRMVQQMLEYIFKDIDIEIVVYIWDENAEDTTSTPPQKQQKLLKKCAVIHVEMNLTEMQKETGLVYFGSVDGYETEVFKNLSDKFNISAAYRAPKVLTDVIQSIDKGEYIYGLINKIKFKDDNDFVVIEKTLRNLSKKLKKDKTVYIGFEAFIDEKDKLIVDKIIALMQYALLDIEIWVCWPDALKDLCPKQNKSYYS